MSRVKDLRKTPLYHITASWGWMNDPCAPGYDPKTGTYHIFYQWNPKGCEWGNMSWGHLASKDMVIWQRTGPQPALAPDRPYDKEGVFTGCFHPTGIRNREAGMTLFYSSICGPSFTWERPPYPRNSAGISAAISKDHGVSWLKLDDNPILNGEPDHLEVTGFRDPYIAPWESMDRLQGSEQSLYAVVGGGIRDKGPGIFLYRVNPDNTRKWNYAGMLLQTPVAFRPSRKWNGDAGINWECPGFLTLTSNTVSREFVIFGTEGGAERDHIPAHSSESAKLPQRVRRWCMWMSGELKNSSDGPKMDYRFGGMLDHGCFYAASSFHDPKHDRRVVWGWVIEDDITIHQYRAKGWTGCLSLPRELFLVELNNVVGARKSQLSDISCIEVTNRGNRHGSTVRTLGVRPLAELAALRAGAGSSIANAMRVGSPSNPKLLFKSKTSKWELKLDIEIGVGCSSTTLRLLHNNTGDKTEIVFSALDEEIIVKRPMQTLSNDVNNIDAEHPWLLNNREERGAHTLFRFYQDSQNIAQEISEHLQLHVFRDGQVLEIFANDRFALSTMIYVDQADEGILDEIQCLAESTHGESNCATVHEAAFWELNKAVIPEDFALGKSTSQSIHSSL